jgi:hypothetical protein
MALADRDQNYMKEMWGTTNLITDYKPERKVLQEVVYDPANKVKNERDLYENNDSTEFEYGIEPTFKLKPNQKVL